MSKKKNIPSNEIQAESNTTEQEFVGPPEQKEVIVANPEKPSGLELKIPNPIEVIKKIIDRCRIGESRFFGGWKPSPPDHRDMMFGDIRNVLFGTRPGVDLPSRASVRKRMAPVYDQGQLGSCTGNAGAACIELAHMTNGKPLFQYSRLWLYLQARILEGNQNEDAGAYGRDIFKAANKVGCPSEAPYAPEAPESDTIWQYDISRFAETPTDGVYKEALNHLLVKYYSIPEGTSKLQQIKQAIAGGPKLPGYCVAFGCPVYSDIQDPKRHKGKFLIPYPSFFQRPEGGHEMVIVSYDNYDDTFEVRNSWGEEWGDGGYAWMPAKYVQRLCTDLWVCVADADAPPVVQPSEAN